MKKLLQLFLILAVLAVSCSKDPVLPHNPYDDVDYGINNPESYNPDPNTIVGIYENILRWKCANPGCHDGHFEPDFRSIQSAWSTLVYHQIVKNTADSAYTFRVQPQDTGASLLWRRITRGNAALQQMPATGALLTQTELDNIRTWIDNGARDMFGNYPVLPNNEPQIQGFVAFDQFFTTQLDVTENRLDSIPYMPFKVDQSTNFNVVIIVEDDSTAVNQLQVNRLSLSLDIDNFGSASNVQASFVTFGGLNLWVAPVSTSPYAAGDTVYMRYYVNDGDHANDTEFPREDHPDVYKTYAAFYVKP